MSKKGKIKVCIMVSSLGVGGAERSSAILSRMLVDAGYDVVVVSIQDNIQYTYKGVLINLEALATSYHGLYKRWKKFIITRKLLSKERFDYIIDASPRPTWFRQWFINTFVYQKIKTVFVVHNYNPEGYFPDHIFLGKQLYHNAYKLVGVSEASVRHFKKVYSLKKGICIYNAFDETHWEELSKAEVPLPESDYIVSYGRIVDASKNYSFLIQTFAKSTLPARGIKLYIMGDGPDKIKIQDLVKDYKIEDSVVFRGFSKNPFPYVKQALFTTLTSNYEGFPMVLIESLAMGTPVVSVDCKSGPSEVIVTGKNGILVPFNDTQAYVSALNKMIEDTIFYTQCKDGAVPSVSKFKIKNIIPAWKAILPPRK